MKYKGVTLIASVIGLCSIGFSDDEEAKGVDALKSEVSSLVAQNKELLSALNAQVKLIEEQQSLIEDLSERIEAVEATHSEIGNDLSSITDIETLELESDSVDRGNGSSIHFGGWAGFVYSDSDRDGARPGFDAHPLYLYVNAKPSENWQFFGEIEVEHLFKSSSSGTKGDLKVERLYLEHEFENSSRVRAGKYFLPFGYWYRTHWHFLTETLSRPFSFNNSYVPRQQVGIEYLDSMTIGDSQLNYYGWVGNGPDVFGTNKRTESDFSAGGAIFLERMLPSGALIGGTFAVHQQKVNYDSEFNAVIGGKFSSKRFELRGEYYRHDREINQDLESGYVSLKLKTSDAFGFVFRHDFGDDKKMSKEPLGETTRGDSVGFMWQPVPHLLFKGEYRLIDLNSESTMSDFNDWNLFSAIKF